MINDDNVRFCDLKVRYKRDFVGLGFHKNPIFSQIGDSPGGFAQINIDGRQLNVETFNLLDFQFFSELAELENGDFHDAGRELTNIVYYNFPVEAFRQETPFPIGFLKEVTIRANLLALTPVQDISDRHERELMRLEEGQLIWNSPLIQSSILPQEMSEGLFGYRFILAFVHPTYGFIDFDGVLAGTLYDKWADRLVVLPAPRVSDE